jgi:catechol 2,3-dioxygenase-like lactoylglutathione lyase family enzyme
MKTIETAAAVLEHVSMTMDDLDAARVLFGETLRLPVVETDDNGGPGLAARAGQTTIRISSTDAPDGGVGRRGWNHVAFKVRSLDAIRDVLEAGGASILDVETGTAGRKALWTVPDSTTGIPLQFVEDSIELQFPGPRADAIVERVDHLGVAARNAAHARGMFSDTLGFPIESTQVDSEVLVPVETTSNDRHGAMSHAGTPIPRIGAGLMATFVTIGDLDLEIMQPLSESTIDTPLGTIPGTVGQDQGAIDRFLQSKGEGLLHMAFKTPDIIGALEAVKSAEIGLIDPVGRPGARNSHIAFMDRKTTHGILLHFVERTPLPL